jgi:hypothetical protein
MFAGKRAAAGLIQAAAARRPARRRRPNRVFRPPIATENYQNEEEATRNSPGDSEGREEHRERRSRRRLRRADGAPAAAALHKWRREEWRGV